MFEGYLFSQSIIFPSLDYKHTHRAYSMLLEELFILKKEKKSNGGYSYFAPAGYHDDCVFSLLVGVVGMQVVLNKIKLREKVKFTDVEYYLSLRKYPKEEQKIQTEQPRQWLCV